MEAILIAGAAIAFGLAALGIHKQVQLRKAEEDEYNEERFNQLERDFLTWLQGGFSQHHFVDDPDLLGKYGYRTSEMRQIVTLTEFREAIPDPEERSRWIDLFGKRHQGDSAVRPLADDERQHLMYGD